MNLEPIWLILLPLIAGFSILFINLYLSKYRRLFISCNMLTLIVLSFILLQQVHTESVVYNLSGWSSWLGINLIVDPLSGLMAFLISVLSGIAVFYSFIYVQENQSKYYTLLFFLTAGMMGMVLTGDLFNLFVFIEVTSLASYALVAFEKHNLAYEASFKYLVMGSVSGFMVLLGIILVYQSTGTLNLAELVSRGADIDIRIRGLILALFTIGLGTKFAIVPLHTWLPAAHPAAPSPISALLSGVVIKVFGYGLLRLISVLYLQSAVIPFNLDKIITWIGVFTLIVGHLTAFQQTNLKRLLAYSSIAQVGYILIGLGSFSSGGIEGAVFHMVNHALVKGSLFLTAGIFVFRLDSVEIEDLTGLGYKLPRTSLLFTVSSLIIIGLPPFNCFISKWLIAQSALQSQFLLPGASIFIGSILALSYYLQVIIKLYTKPEENLASDISCKLDIFPLVLTGLCFVLGVFPSFGLQLIKQIPPFILQPINYYNILLGG